MPQRTHGNAQRKDGGGGEPAAAGLAREEVLAQLRASIGARVRPLLTHMSQDSVEQLIAKMATIQYRYEGDSSLQRSRRGQ
jgi:hypothetical protein